MAVEVLIAYMVQLRIPNILRLDVTALSRTIFSVLDCKVYPLYLEDSYAKLHRSGMDKIAKQTPDIANIVEIFNSLLVSKTAEPVSCLLSILKKKISYSQCHFFKNEGKKCTRSYYHNFF